LPNALFQQGDPGGANGPSQVIKSDVPPKSSSVYAPTSESSRQKGMKWKKRKRINLKKVVVPDH